MSCIRECGQAPSILDDPTKNEEEIWRYVASLIQGCAREAECIPIPILDSPTVCEENFMNWLAETLTLCRKQTLCQYVPPIIDLPCGPNLKAIELAVIQDIGTGGPGQGGGTGGPTIFVPPPCPVDDFTLRAITDNVGNATFPWDERETTDAKVFIIRLSGVNKMQLQVSHRTTAGPVQRAGFMTFGGFLGGPINWAPDHSIILSGAPGPTEALYSASGTPTTTHIVQGLALRAGGTITNFTGYIAGQLTYFAFGPTAGFVLLRFQNVNLTTDLSSQAGAVFLTALSGAPFAMKIVGQAITVITTGGTDLFTDTFGIIAGNAGPGWAGAADFGLVAFGTGGTAFSLYSRRVCVASPPSF